jgi:non-specific serine/threonine protein kinase
VFQFTPDALARAMQHLQRACEIIGENALLQSGLAYVCYQYSNLGLEHEQYIARAMQHANEALVLDPESAEAHLVLGLLHQAFLGDPLRSFMHLKRALSINPDDAHTLFWLCVGHSIVGRTEDAVPLWKRLKEVDPLSSTSHYDVFTDVFGGSLDQPVESLTYWLRMEPQNLAALLSVAWLLPICGHRDEARRLIDEYATVESDVFYAAVSLLFKHAIEGNLPELRRRMTETVKRTARRDPQYSFMLADMHALAGMKDEALDWLENALNRGWFNYPFTVKYDPLLAPFHQEQRFQKIAERMKREWEEFEV